MWSAAPRFAPVRLKLEANFDLFFNVGSLALSTAGAAALGFVFWWLAARSFSAEQLGVASAAISAMSLVGLLGDLGLGTFAIAAIHRTDRAAALISTCLLTAGLCSAVLGFGFCVVAVWLSPDVGEFIRGPLRWGVFILSASVTGIVLVLDQALVGVMRSSLQLTRNLAASVLKLCLLAVFLKWAPSDGMAVLYAWLCAAIASTIMVLVMCARQKCGVVGAPDWRLLRGMGSSILGHHALNLATQVVGLLLPLVVTMMISARANAAFFAAWMIVQVLCLGPAALATVLFPIASRDRDRMARLMQLTLFLSVLIGVTGELLLVVVGKTVLWLFNPEFVAEGYGALVALGAGVIPMAVKYHYVALRRIENRPGEASLILGVAAGFELLCAVIGAHFGSLLGLCLGWLFAATVQALVLFPPLYRAMRASNAMPECGASP